RWAGVAWVARRWAVTAVKTKRTARPSVSGTATTPSTRRTGRGLRPSSGTVDATTFPTARPAAHQRVPEPAPSDGLRRAISPNDEPLTSLRHRRRCVQVSDSQIHWHTVEIILDATRPN